MAVRNRPRWETRNQHMTQWFEHRVVALPHPPMASLPHIVPWAVGFARRPPRNPGEGPSAFPPAVVRECRRLHYPTSKVEAEWLHYPTPRP